MIAITAQNLFRAGLIRCFARDAICGFRGVSAAFFIYGLPLDKKSLPDVGKVKIAVELSCGPYFSDLNPAVIRGIVTDEIRLFSLFKIMDNILKKSGLIVFDGKMVMCVPLPDQIISYIALGKQGICGNFFALDINGIKEGDGCFNLVGTFEFLTTCYRERPDFFWV